MDVDRPLRILIIGAGIGGLTAAVALRAAGKQVTVVERAPAIGAAGGHLGVQSNAVLALRRLGLDGPVIEAGVAVETFTVRSWSGRRLAWWSPGEAGRELGAPSITVPRQLLLSTLAKAVTDPPVRFGRRLVGLREEPDQVVATLSDGESLSADVVVAADGIRSTVRSLLGWPGRVSYAGYTAWRGRADFRPDGLAPDEAAHFLDHSRTIGSWPLPGGGTYWVATQVRPEPEGGDAARLADPRVLSRLVSGLNQPLQAVVEATPATELLVNPIVTLQAATQWFSSRVVMIGDAVHAMQPTTGQGCAQAMLDALALSGHLAPLTGRASADELRRAFAGYENQRRDPVTRIAEEASGVGKMHHVGGPVRRLVRDTVLRATPQRVWQRRTALRLTEAELLDVPVVAAAGSDR